MRASYAVLLIGPDNMAFSDTGRGASPPAMAQASPAGGPPGCGLGRAAGAGDRAVISLRRCLACAMAIALLLLAACDTRPVGQPVTYRNETTESLNISNDEHLVTTLAPRQSKAITTREDLLPDRIRAYTERGDLIFDQTYTWQDLQRLNFIIVITRAQ